MWIARTSDVDRGLDGMTHGGKIAAFESSPPAWLGFGNGSGCSDHGGLELGSLSAIRSRFLRGGTLVASVGIDRRPSAGEILGTV